MLRKDWKNEMGETFTTLKMKLAVAQQSKASIYQQLVRQFEEDKREILLGEGLSWWFRIFNRIRLKSGLEIAFGLLRLYAQKEIDQLQGQSWANEMHKKLTHP